MSPDQEQTQKLRNIALMIVALGVIIAGLVLGRSFLLPLAIALLVWNLLEAVIDRLTSFGIGSYQVPRFVAMLISLGIIAVFLMIVIQILLDQADAIALAVPRYTERLQEIFGNLVVWLGPELANKAQDHWKNINLVARLTGLAGSAGDLLTDFVLVCLYVGFLLAESGYVSRKLLKIFPDKSEAERVNVVLESLSESVRRYISIKTIISMLTGILSYLILRYMDIDFAETWALIIFLLNFIPTIGSTLGVIFPAIIALIQFDTYTPFIVIAVGLTAVQFLIGNVIEPMFMGRSLNLSSFAIILSLTFWGTIWGIAGMVLSVPITVMFMIIAAHIPSWRWAAVVLSKDGKIYTSPD